MARRIVLLSFFTILVTLTVSTKAQSWGGYHVGYTHYSSYTGLHHYGYTRAYGGASGGYRYGGYAYGARGAYGGYRDAGYYRRW